jgi:RNA polymerase sigma factor (sigma-70 family)
MDKEIDKLYTERREDYVKIISRILKGNRDSAEDIVQESFVKSLTHYKSFNPKKGELTKWYHSILFNCLREYYKDRSKQPSKILYDISYEDVEDDFFPISCPEKRQILVDEIAKVKNKKHSKILELFFIFGFTSKEISFIIGDTTVTNVTTIVSRFRENILK